MENKLIVELVLLYCLLGWAVLSSFHYDKNMKIGQALTFMAIWPIILMVHCVVRIVTLFR